MSSNRPRARLATLMAFGALCLAGFALSQVVQVSANWDGTLKSIKETDVRTQNDRLRALEKEVVSLREQLEVFTSASGDTDAPAAVKPHTVSKETQEGSADN